MSSLRTQTLWSMLPILVTSVVSVVSVPLYFQVLGDEMYAMWFYVGTLTGAFGFMDLGMGVAAGRFIGVAMGRGDQKAVEEYWATSHVIVFPFVLFFAFVFVVVGAFFAPEWFKLAGRDAATLRWAILWGGIGLFFSYYGQMWIVLAQAHLDFKYLSILRTWTGMASTLGTVGVALLSRNVAVIMAYATALGLLQFVLLCFRTNSHYKLPLKISNFRKSRLLEMLPYTIKTFGQLISGSVLGSLDRIFLGRLAPAPDFAAFGVSQNISGRIAGLSVAIMGPVFNNTSRGLGGDTTKQPRAVYEESFDFMAKWLGLIIVWVVVWQGPVLEFWLGEERGGLVQTSFAWVVAGFCITSLSNISAAQLGSFNKVGTSLLFSVATNLASAVLVCAGWYLSGLHGAAIGFFLARTILLLQDAYTRGILGAGYGSNELHTLVYGLTCLLLFGVARFVGDFLSFSVGALVVSALVCGVIAAAFILASYFRRRPTIPTIP